FPILLHKGNPFLNNSTQFRIDLGLIVSMTAGADNPRTLPDKTLIGIRPFDYLDVERTVFHRVDSWIFLRTSRSWYGLASSPSCPEMVTRAPCGCSKFLWSPLPPRLTKPAPSR